MNELYKSLSGQNNGIVQRFRQFQQTFNGDPRTQIQQMMQSGKISQAQYDQAVRTANQIRSLFGI